MATRFAAPSLSARCADGRGNEPPAARQRRRHAPHVARYFARVDAHLRTLPDDAARIRFLHQQIASTEARYENFGARVEAGAEVDPDVQAADFIVTIADLRTRANQYQPRIAA